MATGNRLSVDFAYIEPTSGTNFVLDGKMVTGCRGLEKLPVTRSPVVLQRKVARPCHRRQSRQ